MFNFLINLKIPDFVFLILISAFLIWFYFILKRLKEKIEADIEEIESEIRRINEELEPKKITEAARPEREIDEDLPKKDEIIELSDEHIFVLSAIADEPEKMYQQEKLFQLYNREFSDKDRSEFDLITKELETHNLIKSDSTSDYKVWLEISDKGLEYLEKKRRNQGK